MAIWGTRCLSLDHCTIRADSPCCADAVREWLSRSIVSRSCSVIAHTFKIFGMERLPDEMFLFYHDLVDVPFRSSVLSLSFSALLTLIESRSDALPRLLRWKLQLTIATPESTSGVMNAVIGLTKLSPSLARSGARSPDPKVEQDDAASIIVGLRCSPSNEENTANRAILWKDSRCP